MSAGVTPILLCDMTITWAAEDLSHTKEALEATAKKLEITVQELVETKDELGQIRYSTAATLHW